MTERRAAYHATEHEEQAALFEWAATVPALGWMFAIPNGTRTTPGTARKMVEEGVRKGVSDVFLPLARGGYYGLFIEMKSATGRPSPEQLVFVAAMRGAGYMAEICRGWEAARDVILHYMGVE